MSEAKKIAEARLGELAGEMEVIYSIFPALRPEQVGPPVSEDSRKLHWTQRPENREKLLAMRKKQSKAMKARRNK